MEKMQTKAKGDSAVAMETGEDAVEGTLMAGVAAAAFPVFSKVL